MNTLTTRKIVLGLLMTLVLAFGMQSVADAVQTPRLSQSNTDIAKFRTPNETFSVSIPTLSFDAIDTPGETVTITFTDGITPIGQLYDISLSGGAATLTENGRAADPGATPPVTAANGTKFTFGKNDGNTGEVNRNFTIQGRFDSDASGRQTVTIAGTDNAGDDQGSWTFTYIYHVTPAVTTGTPALAGLTNGYSVGDFGDSDQLIHTGADNLPIVYTPRNRLVMGHADLGSDRIAVPSGPISSAFNVYLRRNSTTDMVTATVRGLDDSTIVGVYIYGFPTLEVDGLTRSEKGGMDNPGKPGEVIRNAFTATVKDGSGRGVPGVIVKFDETTATGGGDLIFGSGNSGILVAANNTLIRDTTTNQIITAGERDPQYVRTNSSGKASIDLRLGSAGTQTATVSVVDTTDTTFRSLTENVEAFAGSRAGNQLSVLRIVSVPGSSDTYYLYALVEKDGQKLVPTDIGTGDLGTQAYDVVFRTDDGTLSNTPPSGISATTDEPEVIERPNSDSVAEVSFKWDGTSSNPEVTASLVETIGGVQTDTHTVTFNIRGGVPQQNQQNQQNQQQQPGARLVAVPSPVTGAPGSPQSITISAVDANNNPVTGASITLDPFSSFISAGGSYSSSSGNSPFALTLTLPTTADSYSFSAASLGYPSISITVTVGGTAAPGVSPTLVADQERITGTPGSPQLVSVTAQNASGNAVEGVSVTFTIVGFATQTATTDVLGSAGWNLTLPTALGPYTLNITADGYESATVPITVSTAAPGTRAPTGLRLLRSDGNNQTGEPGALLSEPLVVTVVDNAGQAVSNQVVQFSATRGGGRVSPLSDTTDARGRAQTRLRLGRTAGTNTVVATLNGITATFTATAALAPALLEVYDGNNQRGVLNTELTDPLAVIVEDSSGNGVAGVNVRFQVTSRNARLSQRGTGYAARVDTDRNGVAEAPITPTGAGPITVRATVNGLDPVTFTITTGPPPTSLTIASGDNQAGTPGSALANPLVVEVQDAEGGAVDGVVVTFEVTAGGGSLSAETATTNAQGRAQTRLTLGSERAINSVRASVTGLDPVTFNTSVDAVIHVAASNRPVMYWIDGGALYHLAGAKAQRIAASANDVAVDMTDGKIYWIEGTSDRTGTIHSANVDGTGATVVKELTSVPIGLAHDSASGKLYLTNSWGKIQRMNVDGTAFETNLIVGLGNPMDIAVASGKVYWTDAAGSVRYANTEGVKIVRNIATGSGALGGIVVGSDKVYWTEQTGNITGRVRSANLDGTGVADLFALTAVPAGIAVDGNTVYWANGWGKVQRRNIDGSKFQDVVTGLMSPGAVAIGGANVATTPTTTTTTPTTTTVKSKYDVNGDGKVDNADAALVAGAMGTSTAAYDVNGDGTVNFLDLLLVFDNRDPGAAGAPTVVPTQLTAVQVDRIQEQIDLLIGMNDRSPTALYTLRYLQSLIAAARPGKTQLLANYPNPFNPETWIPYELATDTNVKLTIYNAQGIVVRTLSIGHQSAGYYTSRDRAAYWDGRNAFGELVASGLYFYQLETDETSSMRKMVILK